MKKTLDIRLFNKGTLSKPDAEDIPIDACVSSNNIDPNSDGSLKPIRGNTEYDPTITSNIVNSAWIERDTGEKDLIFGNDTDIGAVTDFYGTLGLTASLASSTATCMVSDKNSVHIGTEDEPKWVGYIGHKQFNSSPVADITIEDADVANVESIPFFYKAFNIIIDSTDYIFGIEWQGDRLFKLNMSTGVLDISVDGMFKQVQGVCTACDSTDYVWVYDAGVGVAGTLFKINTDDLSVDNSILLAGYTPDYDTNVQYISDIEEFKTGLGTYAVALGIYHEDISSSLTRYLAYYIATDADNGDDVSALMYYIIYGSGGAPTTNGEQVYWNVTASDWRTYNRTVVTTYKRNLIKTHDYEVGVLAKYKDVTSGVGDSDGQTIYYYWYDGGDNRVEGTVFIRVADIYHLPAGTGGQLPAILVGSNSYAYDSLFYSLVLGGLYLTRTTDTDEHLYTLPAQLLSAGKVMYSEDSLNTLDTDPDEYFVGNDYDGEILYLRQTTKPTIAKIDTGLTTITDVYDSQSVLISITDGSITYFEADTTVFYKYSLIYDNIQETPLSIITWDNTSITDKTLTISVSSMFRRVSAINIYASSGASSPEELYRLVETIEYNDSRWVEIDDRWVISISDIGDRGATYEANSGFPENINNITPYYQVSAELNNSLFIGDCTHPKLDDASHTIFKSKTFRYDSFDWVNEALKVPFIPKGMAGFAGRLFVFDNARTFIANPNLFIEDIKEGIGITTSNAYVVTDYGMFWADRNGCYHTVDGSIKTISKPIEDLFRVDSRYVVNVKYDAASNCVLFFCQDNPLETESGEGFTLDESTDILYTSDSLLSYHIFKERWDERRGFTTGDFYGAVTGINGETYVSESEGFMKCFTGDYKDIEWISQEFTFDSPSQYKYIYELALDSPDTLLLEYSTDHGATYTTFTGSLYSSSWLKAKTFKFKISGTATEVRALSIKFRELVTK